MKHRAFFGDAEYVFALPVPMIIELEKKTGVGIGALCSRLFASQFSHSDIVETIRLAVSVPSTRSPRLIGTMMKLRGCMRRARPAYFSPARATSR